MVPAPRQSVWHYRDIIRDVIAVRVPQPQDPAYLADIAVRHIASTVQVAVGPELEAERLMQISRKDFYLPAVHYAVIIIIGQYQDLTRDGADKQAASRVKSYAGRTGAQTVEVRNERGIGEDVELEPGSSRRRPITQLGGRPDGGPSGCGGYECDKN